MQAFMHRPDLLVLDEPTSGLDPVMQQVFYELVRETAADGRARARLVVDDLRTRAFTRVEVTFASPPPSDAFARISAARELKRRGRVVLFALEGRADPLVKALARYEVEAIDVHEADLEDVFLSLYRGVVQRAA